MTRIVRNWTALSFLIVITVAITFVVVVHAQEASAQKTYRLVRVKIPPDSPHRLDKKLNAPPKPYVIILKNGEQIGKASSVAVGWEAEFPDKSRNHWDISSDASASYTVQLWDSQWGRDVMIFSKTELNATAFASPIKEDLGHGYSQKNAVSVEFAEVPAPPGK